jgi:purine-binding chemotaxis protein CheW
MLDLRGQLVPVVDLGLRFGAEPRVPALDDRLVVVEAAARRLALHVRRHIELRWVQPDEVRPPPRPEGRNLHGFVAMTDGLIVIYDVDALLTAEDELRLDEALARLDRTDHTP